MRRPVVKYILFFAPFLVAALVELFVLPLHFFSFRVWESMRVLRSFGILEGPFYPNMVVTKIEEGDLAYRTGCAVKKHVTWKTDEYGYRKAPGHGTRYPVVIVGDSNIAGSSLTQEDLISEALERRLKVGVYPLSPERITGVFEHPLTGTHPPDIVVFTSIERYIADGALRRLKGEDFSKPSLWSEAVLSMRLQPPLQKAAVVLDRLLKGNMLNFLRARINSGGPSEAVAPRVCPLFFVEGASANRDVPEESTEAAAQELKIYSEFFSRRGIRFVFLPIPNKENIYHEYLHTRKPPFLAHLIDRLRELKVDVVDTQEAFDRAQGKTAGLLYHSDDSHWNCLGVRVAADALAAVIGEKPAAKSR
jgi:alginate O-acetyltransferase complex protein AlgJ